MNNKLSKAQLAVLQRLVNGSGFYITDNGAMGATRQMETNLKRLGRIETTENGIVITPAGRAALEAAAAKERVA